MQQQRWIACGLMALVALAVPASAEIIIPTLPGYDTSSPGMDWFSVENNGDGMGDAQNADSENSLVGAMQNGNLCRAHWVFDIDDTIDPSDILIATLNVRLKSVLNGPSATASLFHSQESTAGGNDISTGTQRRDAFHDPGFVDTGMDIADPASTAGMFYAFDVTSFVVDDLINDADDAYSNFRAQLDGAAAKGDVPPGERYVFNSGDDLDPALRPFLSITLVPEPAGLMLIGLAGMLILRRR